MTPVRYARAAATIVALAVCRHAAADPRVVRIRVDLTSESPSVAAKRVDDDARVVLHVTKSVFHSCMVTSKVEPIAAPPNPVAQILAMLSGIPGTPAVLRPQEEPETPAPPRGSEPLQRQLEDLLRDTAALNADLDDQLGQIRDRALSLPRWSACDTTRLCPDPDAARERLDQLAAAIQRTPSQPIASVTVAAGRTAELLKTLDARLDEPSEDDGVWLQWAFSRLRAIEESIDLANERRQSAAKGREALLAVRDRILAFSTETSIEEPLPSAENARTSITVSCANVVTQQPFVYRLDENERVVASRTPSASVTIVYQSAPRVAVSAGALYSFLDRGTVGVAAHRIGVDEGVVSYQRRVVENDRAAWQVVPFSFVTIIAPGFRGRQVSPAASAGVGLNPNNGGTVAEFFAGGAVTIGRAVTLQLGVHFGSRVKPAGQFAVGDVVPDRLTAVPTTRSQARALAIGMAYRLPLPR
jgi:hypothetical protein